MNYCMRPRQYRAILLLYIASLIYLYHEQLWPRVGCIHLAEASELTRDAPARFGFSCFSGKRSVFLDRPPPDDLSVYRAPTDAALDDIVPTNS